MTDMNKAPMIGGGLNDDTTHSSLPRGDGYGSVTILDHVTAKLKQHGVNITRYGDDCQAACPCGGNHYVTLTYDKEQRAIYPDTGGNQCRYKNDTRALLKAWKLDADDLWNDGAWNKDGIAHDKLPDKPATTPDAGDREHHATALADTGDAPALSPATPVADGRRDTPGTDDARRPDGYTWNEIRRSPSPKFLYPGVFPLCGFTLVYGEGGTFKSAFMRWVAAQVSSGKLPGEYNGTPANVVIVHNGEDTMKLIMQQVKRMGGDVNRVFVFNPLKYDDPLEATKRYVKSNPNGVALVILDSVTSFADDVNDAKKVETFVSDWNCIADQCNIAVVGISHRNKFTETARGSYTGSAKWEATARSVVCIAKDLDDGDGAMVSYAKVTKCNGAQSGTMFAIHAGTFTPEGDGYDLDPMKYRATDTAPLLVHVGKRQEFPYVRYISETDVDVEWLARVRKPDDDERMEAKERADMVVAWIDAQPGHEAYRTAIDEQFTKGDDPMSASQLGRLLRRDKRLGRRKEKKEHGKTVWYVKHDKPVQGAKFDKYAEYEQSQGFPDTMPGAKFDEYEKYGAGPNSANYSNFATGGSVGTVGNTLTRQTIQTLQAIPAPDKTADTPPDSAGYAYANDYPWSDATDGQLEHIRATDTRQAFKAHAADELNRRRQG